MSNANLIYTYKLICQTQFSVGLERCSTWKDKLQLFKKLCPPEQFGMTEEFQRDFCTAIYNRVTAIIEYDVSKLSPIRSPITLLKPTLPAIRLDIEDYDLSQVRSFSSVYLTYLSFSFLIEINIFRLQEAKSIYITYQETMSQCSITTMLRMPLMENL